MRNLDTLSLGGISSLDSFATQRALSAPEPVSNESDLRDDLLTAALTQPVAKEAHFAPLVPLPFKRGHRVPSIAECLQESLEYRDGPQMADVLQLLCSVAKGEDQASQAKALLLQMAVTWAAQNATVEYDDPVERFRAAEGL